jgi:Ca2+-transporting ATPase
MKSDNATVEKKSVRNDSYGDGVSDMDILPVALEKRGRTPSDATTIRPPSASSDPFATPTMRSRSSTLATVACPPVNSSDALRPDPGTEADFEVKDNPFAFSPGQLGKMLNPKSLEAFRALGGLKGIERGLHANVATGLSVDETTVANRISFDQAVGDLQKKPEMSPHHSTGSGAFVDRSRVYGKNVLPSKAATPLYKVMDFYRVLIGQQLTKMTPTAYVERLQGESPHCSHCGCSHLSGPWSL